MKKHLKARWEGKLATSLCRSIFTRRGWVTIFVCIETFVFSQMAQELVRLGAEVDLLGSDGMTPLHYACRFILFPPSELCWALTQKQKNWSRDTFNHFLTRTIRKIRFKISIPQRKGKLSGWTTLCLHRVIVMQEQCYAVVLVMIILIGVIS